MDETTFFDALATYHSMKLTGVAENTRKGAELHLNMFRRWVATNIQPNPYVSELSGRVMSDYFNTLRPPRLAPSTFNVYRQSLLGFWKFCYAEDWVRRDPMTHVARLKVPQKNRIHLSPYEVRKMLDETKIPRDRALLAIGVLTGLRGGDVIKHRVGDINLGDRTFSVTNQKTGKADILPVDDDLRAELMRWFEAYAEAMGLDGPEAIPNGWWLIPPQHPVGGGFRLAPTSEKPMTHAERVVHDGLALIGMDRKGEGTHTLRRTAGRIFYHSAMAQGVDDPMRIPQSMYGHSNRTITENYLGITHDKRVRDNLISNISLLDTAAGELAKSTEFTGGWEVRDDAIWEGTKVIRPDATWEGFPKSATG